MTLPLRSLCVFLILPVLVAAGCASLPPGAGQSIGVLRVSGPNVWLDQVPARDGDPVRIGSSLATGPGSSALLEFRDGGYLQLDENTDPIFEWLAQSKCILIRILKGQAYLKRERACVEGPNLSLVLNSEANLRIEAQPGVSEVTLLRGSAEISVPDRLRLLPGQRFVAGVRTVASLRNLTPNELRSVVAWRGNYRFQPLPAPKPEAPGIVFPPWPKPPRRSEPGLPPKPEPPGPEPPPPGEPGKPPGTGPLRDGIRLPPDLIERRREPVIR